jgi:arginyl-tRNA synthetase
MATVRHMLTEQVVTALRSLPELADVELPRVVLSPPKQEAHGDFACNIALALAKPLKKKPRDIATQLQAALGDAGGLLDKTEIAGPGFLNMFVTHLAWH